jgi:TATA-binding protein-associated factor
MQRIYDTKETKKNMKRPWELPPLKIRSTTKGTVFGQSFLSVTLDEAHNARNLSLNYYASLRVFQQAIIKLALTGTPLLTGPKVRVFCYERTLELMDFQDIAMMGRLIAVPHFLSEASVVEEIEDKAAVRRAKRMDDDGRSLRIVQIESVRRMQTHFIGSILRRTTDSLTWDGRTLLNLPPHVDVIGILTLTKREMDIINVRAEAAKARYA